MDSIWTVQATGINWEYLDETHGWEQAKIYDRGMDIQSTMYHTHTSHIYMYLYHDCGIYNLVIAKPVT